MSELYDCEFIRKYLNGECSKEERENFLNFLGNPSSQELNNWMKQVWEEGENDHQVFLGAEERILQKILQKLPDHKPAISATQLEKKGILYSIKNTWHSNYTLRYAAIILFFMVVSFMINTIHPKPANLESFISNIERSTHNGQHLAFMLDDGTKIHLNSNSKVIYPETFSDSSREVYLTGEGFFEVAHDSQRPFKVITGDVSTTALGTSFNIHYNQNKADISLVTGRVKVETKESAIETESFILSPGHELHCDLLKDSYLIDEFNVSAVAGWKDGILYFENASLHEMTSKLESWYDVTIATENKSNQNLKNWSYSGKFEKQTLDNVLHGIGYVEKFTYKIDGKNVTLMFN